MVNKGKKKKESLQHSMFDDYDSDSDLESQKKPKAKKRRFISSSEDEDDETDKRTIPNVNHSDCPESGRNKKMKQTRKQTPNQKGPLRYTIDSQRPSTSRQMAMEVQHNKIRGTSKNESHARVTNPKKNIILSSQSNVTSTGLLTTSQQAQKKAIGKGQKYECIICGDKFSSNWHFSRHKTLHNSGTGGSGEKFECTDCGKKYSDAGGLRMHRRNKHMPNRYVDKKFKCLVCGKGFSSTVGLSSHKKVHNRFTGGAGQNFKCTVCGKCFCSHWSLTRHKKTHNRDTGGAIGTNDGKFACQHCGQIYTTFRLLTDHHDMFVNKNKTCPFKRIEDDPETGEAVFQCVICEKRFKTNRQMVLHMDLHNYIPEDRYKKEGDENDDRKNFVCDVCGRNFASKGVLQKHKKNIKTIIDESRKKYPCTFCALTFVSVQIHEIQQHQVILQDKEISKSWFQTKNPLFHPNGYQEREEVSRNLADNELNWFHEWIKVYTAHQLHKSAIRSNGVYICAVLGKKYIPESDVYKFIRDNPDQILGLYIGKDAGGSRDVNSRHWIYPETSHLAQAAQVGCTVVCLERIDVEGTWEEKTKKLKELESLKINLLLTDQEYLPVPGIIQYKILNKNKEESSLLNVDDSELKTMYTKALTGFPAICFMKGCDRLCSAGIHPDWEKGNGMIVPILDRIPIKKQNVVPKVIFNPAFGSYQDKLPRPSSKKEIEIEVKRRISDLKRNKKTEEHFLYTILTVPVKEFPEDWNEKRVCESIIQRKDENMHIGVYCGVNGKPSPADYHTENPEVSSVWKSVSAGNRAVIIGVEKYATRILARKAEALRIMFHHIQKRFYVPGIQFQPLNLHMEWASLSLCDERDVIEVIKMGYLGTSPVCLDESTLKHQINLRKQMNLGRLQFITFEDNGLENRTLEVDNSDSD